MRSAIWITTFVGVFMALMLAASGGVVLDPVALIGFAVLGLCAVVLLYPRIGERPVLARLTRGGVVLLPLLLAALIPIFLVFAMVGGSDVRLWQALLAGFVVVLGWLSTFMFQEERIAQDRRTKEIDILFALRAEILNFVWKFQDEDFDGRIAELESARKNSGRRLPLDFIPRHSERIVFRSVAGNLTLIDDVALSRVVTFYTQVEDIAQLAEDLRDPEFASKGNRDFRIGQLVKYLEMHKLAIIHGLRAVSRMNQVIPADRVAAVDRVAGETPPDTTKEAPADAS